MQSLKFIADMNISPQTVTALKLLGYSIFRVSETLPANSSDVFILSISDCDRKTKGRYISSLTEITVQVNLR